MSDAAVTLLPSAHEDTFCRDSLPPLDLWPDLTSHGLELSYPDRLNCATELLSVTSARLGPTRPCLLAPGADPWTYGDLDRMSDQVASVLVTRHGVVPGNRVLLRGPNNPWLVAAWFGVLKAGAVAVTTMPLLRTQELTSTVDLARISLALCDHRFLDELRPLVERGLVVQEYGGSGADDLTLLCREQPESFDAVETSADDVALLAFTSGTTGRAKATMHFHRDVLAIADTFSAHVLGPEPDDVFTGTPPLGFTFGLGGLVVFPLRVGASSLLLEAAPPPELARQVERHSATVLFTAPTGYRAMLAGGEAPRLRSLRRAVSAGEHLHESTWRDFAATTGVRLIDGIGATEMLHVFISAADDDIRPGATGRPVPGYRARIVDANGAEVANGTPGRLAVQGPTGCRYLADDRQRVYVQDGWNVTGDTFSRDDDGYFWYHARSDDMIISSGYNIGGPEVEEAVLSHPEVVDCGVVGAPDELRGQVVKAFVVLRDRENTDVDEVVRSIQEHVKSVIAPYKYPREVEVVDALPRTSTGKLQRFLLRATAAGSPP